MPWGVHIIVFLLQRRKQRLRKIIFSRHKDNNGQSRIWIKNYSFHQNMPTSVWSLLRHISSCISQVSHTTFFGLNRKAKTKQTNKQKMIIILFMKIRCSLNWTVKTCFFWGLWNLFHFLTCIGFSFQILPL